MKEIMEQILSAWNNYWGDGCYQYLLLAAILYLAICCRKNKATKYILGYVFLVLFLFFCPVTASIIRMCIGENVYWRVLWILQLVPVVSFAATEFLKERKKIVQPVLVILFAAVIVLSGKGIYESGYYKEINNYQKVPDSVAAIGNLIRTDAGDEKVIAATDNYIGSYLRVYDPSIYMLYGREARGAVIYPYLVMYQEVNAVEKNYDRIGWAGRLLACNYLIVEITAEPQKAEIEAYDYHEIGTVNQYCVFRLGESAESYRNLLLFPTKTDKLNTIN